jgi:hypothetical protein
VLKVELPVFELSAWPVESPLPVLIDDAVPVVVALFTAVVPVKVVLPLRVLSPAIDSVPVVCTKPDPSTTIFPPALVTPKPLVKLTMGWVPTPVPFC